VSHESTSIIALMKAAGQEGGKALLEQLLPYVKQHGLLIEQEWLGPKQVAIYTGLSIKCLEDLRKSGRGPRYYKPAGRVLLRYRRSDIDAWMLAGAVNPQDGAK
jgi:predicted DNA-binding transcriptional regulator AlpA